LDDAKKKLGDAVDKHGDKISDGLDKAGHAIDEKTGGKYRDKINTGVSKTKDALDGLDGKRDDLSATAGGSQPPDPSPVPPEPGADPNEDIAAGVRPIPSGGAK
ncbi:MAG: antitoxin, partial [Marmoricola sp.]